MRLTRVLLALIPMAIALSCCASNAPRAAALRALITGVHQQTLDGALKDLRIMKPPVGAPKSVFEQLRDELVRQLQARGVSKFTSTPPSGDANRVNDLGITANGDGTYTLRWSYYNRGDYDQNGSVGITDITPIAMHYNEDVPIGNSDSIQMVIHGSDAQGQKVGISDVTPIAMNFAVDCAKYEVQGAPAVGAFSPIHDVLIGEATGKADGRAKFSYAFSIGANRRFRVVPVDGAGAAGVESNEVSVNPTPPTIVSVQPLTGDKNAPLSLTSVVNGSQPFTYDWQFGASGSPTSSTYASPSVTYSTVGVYDCTLTVTNAYGNDTFNFSLDIKETAKPPLELWYFQMVNLLVDQNVTDAITLMQRAKDAGYTKALIADFKFGTCDGTPDFDDGTLQHYWDNVTEFATQAAAKGVEVVPGLVPIGYSDAFLCHDPNLIEGQPVVDADFVVSSGGSNLQADVVQDATIVNGGFEDGLNTWGTFDGPTVDNNVFNLSAPSCSFDVGGGSNFRLTKTGANSIVVKPWNCYIVSFWMKTENVSPAGSFNAWVSTPDIAKMLCYNSISVASTQDWTQYHIVFNSQEATSVWMYMGLWGGNSGKFWIDDVTIENAGLINLIRRDGAPFSVKSADGQTTYSEGGDYDYVSDPLMGHATYTGTYDLYHDRPVINIPAGSPIHAGDYLRVSYYHAVFVYDMQPTVCLTDPAVDTIIHDTLAKVNELINPSEVFIGVDEMRVANWCKSCTDTGKTPGQLLADMTARIETIAHEVNPAWKLLTWSDMYDPNHNAVNNYYLVNGDLANSWDGLPPSWDIGNWLNSSDNTLTFFEGLGNRQILAGYYDEGAKGTPQDYYIYGWLTRAKNLNADGVYGAMYTTWVNDFSQLENWAASVHQWETDNP